MLKKLYLDKSIHIAFFFTLALTACSAYKTPGVSKAPSEMSAATLCHRYAGAKHDPALGEEVRRRGLDCARELEYDPLYHGERRY